MSDNEIRDDLDPTAEFSREQDAAEFSPAQPEEHRIDDDDAAARVADDAPGAGEPHTKHERTGRMTH